MLMYYLYTALQGIFLPCTRGLANGLITVFTASSTVRCFDDVASLPFVGNEMDPSPLCHDEIAQHQTGIEERGSTYEQV